MSYLTYSELERAAYISGNTVLADAYHAMDKLEALDDSLPLEFDFDDPESMGTQLDSYVEKQIEKQCPDYADYREFFFDCFHRLNGHYPCPEVTSDYDKSVIFEVIERGEENQGE